MSNISNYRKAMAKSINENAAEIINVLVSNSDGSDKTYIFRELAKAIDRGQVQENLDELAAHELVEISRLLLDELCCDTSFAGLAESIVEYKQPCDVQVITATNGHIVIIDGTASVPVQYEEAMRLVLARLGCGFGAERLWPVKRLGLDTLGTLLESAGYSCRRPYSTLWVLKG